MNGVKEKVRTGKRTCKALLRFLADVVEIETIYTNQLRNLIKTGSFKITLKKTLNDCRDRENE